MPWTTGDVDRFKQGLSQAQKRRWVAIANDALRRCRQRGGSNCDASAIRQANSQVGNEGEKNNIEHLTIQTNSHYQVRQETFNDKPHLVVPVIMMVEGVHNGSHGAMFHSASELGSHPWAWNGQPVVVNHPQQDGVDVSANEPQILQREKVGTVFNARMDDNALKAEAWIDEQRLTAVSPSTLERIRQGEMLEVSIGVFTDEQEAEGDWQGEHYVAVARNHRPDHLALLPDSQGACSVGDGCGVRINENNNKQGGKDMPEIDFKQIAREGYAVSLISNRQGFKELVTDIQRKLDAMDTDTRIHFLEEVYDDGIFVYRVNEEGQDTKYYQRTYEVKQDNSIEFSGEPQQVRKDVTFETMQKRSIFNRLFNNNNKKEDSQMTKTKNEKPCCPEKVNQLIANELTRFTEDDKEWLLEADEKTLDKLFPIETAKKEEEPANNKQEPPVQTNKETEGVTEDQVKSIFSKYDKPEEFVDRFMPPELAGQIKSGLSKYRDYRSRLIKSIVDNSEGFTKEKLETWDDADLEALRKNIVKQQPADYSGMGGEGTFHDNQEDEVPKMLPIGVNEEKKEDK